MSDLTHGNQLLIAMQQVELINGKKLTLNCKLYNFRLEPYN